MENSTSTTRASIVGIDVVELAVTCSAAALIMVAVGLLLFYFCTTPRQRERYCRRCARTRHSVEQIQTAPISWKDLKAVTNNCSKSESSKIQDEDTGEATWAHWQADFSKLKYNIYNFNSLFTCRCSKEMSNCCLNNVREYEDKRTTQSIVK